MTDKAQTKSGSDVDPKALLEGLRLMCPTVMFERDGLRWSVDTHASVTLSGEHLSVNLVAVLRDALGAEVDRRAEFYLLDDEGEGQTPFQLAHAISERHRAAVDEWFSRRERAQASAGKPHREVCVTDLMHLLDPAAPTGGVGRAAQQLEVALDGGLAFEVLPPSIGGAWNAYRNDDFAVQRAVIESARAGAKRVVLALAKAWAWDLEHAEEERLRGPLRTFEHGVRTLFERFTPDALRWLGENSAEAKTIYVAGSRHDRARIHEFVEDLRRAGWEVTLDWTQHPGFDAPDPGPSAEILVEAALMDLDAVRRARAFWYVAPAGLSEGSSTELGAALALCKEVVVSGALDRHRIFPRLGERHFVTHEEALAYLCASV